MSPGTTDAAFSECTSAGDALPLRQGDVVEEVSPKDSELRFGVIVTADCDIAQQKHNNTLSYVPVYSLRRYLASFYIPRRLEKSLAQIRQEVTRRANELRQIERPGSGAFSEDAIDVWSASTRGDAIADAIGARADRRRSDFVRMLDAYAAARSAKDTTVLTDGLTALATLREQQGSPPDKAYTKVTDDLQSYLKSLPGDAFFIASIGDEEERRSGFVAYLRVLRELHPDDVALRPADLRSSTIRVKRVARLSSPFVYRLTQQLASVFSSIGLPTAYEQERDRIATTVKKPVP